MTALIVIAVLAGAVWGLVVMRRMALVHAALAVVLLGACLGYGFLSLELGGAHWTLDRFALPVLVAMFVLRWWQGRLHSYPLRREDWLLLGLMGWFIVSTFTHDYHVKFGDQAASGGGPVWRLSTGFLIPALLYWIVRQSELGERELRVMSAVLLLLGLYLSFIGLCEITQQWALVFPKFIADPTLGIHYGRARGPMLSSVSYGLFLGVPLLYLLAARNCLGWIKWLLLVGAVPLMLAGIIFTYTRSVWMGVGLGILVVLALTLQGRARILIVGALASSALLLGVAKFDKLLAFERESTSAATVQESVTMRLCFTYVSWQMFRDYPLAGVGFGQFPTAKLPYLSDRSTDLNLELIRDYVHHNTLLCLLVETGAVGLTLFLAMVFFWGRSAWGLYRDVFTPPWARAYAAMFLSVLALYACQLMWHDLGNSTIDNTIVFLLAGVTVGLRNAAEAARPAIAVTLPGAHGAALAKSPSPPTPLPPGERGAVVVPMIPT